MNERNEENLKKLFEKFVGGDEAERNVEDIRRAEQILRENPPPQPSDELINEIKSGIALELLRKQTTTVFSFRRTAYKLAAIAAVVIILSAIGVKFLEKGGESGKIMYASIIPTSVWESDDIAADDADLAVLNAEIEQIEGEMLSLESGGNGENGQRVITELEMELIEIESDFWKG